MKTITTITNTIGESPIWQEQSKSIVWVEAAGRNVFEYFPESGVTKYFDVPFDITAIVPCDNGQWICASKQGFFLSSPSLDTFTLIADPFAHSAIIHMNDAVSSPRGQLWFGSMNCDQLASPDGQLFAFVQESVMKMDSGFSVANGICFNEPLKRVYCSNMFQRKVYEYQLDESMTQIIGKAVFVEFDANEGYPDGLCTDKAGNVYVCHWDNGLISYYMPLPEKIGSAKKLGDISLPVKHATRCTFGGQHFDTLFVTTANFELTPEESQRYPQSGQLFVLDAPTQGSPECSVNLASLRVTRLDETPITS